MQRQYFINNSFFGNIRIFSGDTKNYLNTLQYVEIKIEYNDYTDLTNFLRWHIPEENFGNYDNQHMG
jgi:hypothetical protein